MRTFQYSDARSHKFWSIDVQGTSFTVTYGKVGTAGQVQTKSFASPEKAQAEADKLIKEKLKKGYAEVGPKPSTSEADALEAAIRANPHDRAAHAAYADWLTERGDPRGEFIQVQLALEDESVSADQRKKLKAREKALLKKHEKEWVGNWPGKVRPPTGADSGQLNAPGEKKYAFERGLLTTVAVGDITVPGARALVAAPQLKFVRNLFVGGVAFDDDDYDDEDEDLYDEDGEEKEDEEEKSEPADATSGPDIPEGATDRLGQYPLLRWPQLRYVRNFTWGWPAEEDYGVWANHRCWMPGDHVYDFVKQMPDVEELHIFAHVRDAKKLVALPMPNLRVFELYHGWSYPLEKLAENKTLTNLTHLHCHPHGLEPDDQPYIRLKQLRAVCRSPHLKNLTHLRLRLADFGDEGVKEIVDSGVLKRLKVLDLRHGCISDEGAKLLAACPDLKKLELLDLSYNALTKEGIAALTRTGVRLDAGHMHGQTRYDPSDFTEFLAHGDPE